MSLGDDGDSPPAPTFPLSPAHPHSARWHGPPQKNISHWTNQFNLKKHASKNILRNVKATFKRKTSKTLENAWLRQASIIVLGWFDKNSSPPCLWMTVFTQKTFFFKNNYSNPPLKWGLHFNPPFLFLWFPNWHLPDFREEKKKNVNLYKMSSSCSKSSRSWNSSSTKKENMYFWRIESHTTSLP